MSNIKKLRIEGKIPYNWVDHQAVQPFLKVLCSPSIGLKVTYSGQETRPIPGSSGRMTYYGFRIEGEEALSDGWIGNFLQALVNAGAEIVSPIRIHDIENDYKYPMRVPVPDANDRNGNFLRVLYHLSYTVKIAPAVEFRGVLEAPSMPELRKLAKILVESSKNEVIWGEVTKMTVVSLGIFIV